MGGPGGGGGTAHQAVDRSTIVARPPTGPQGDVPADIDAHQRSIPAVACATRPMARRAIDASGSAGTPGAARAEAGARSPRPSARRRAGPAPDASVRTVDPTGRRDRCTRRPAGHRGGGGTRPARPPCARLTTSPSRTAIVGQVRVAAAEAVGVSDRHVPLAGDRAGEHDHAGTDGERPVCPAWSRTRCPGCRGRRDRVVAGTGRAPGHRPAGGRCPATRSAHRATRRWRAPCRATRRRPARRGSGPRPGRHETPRCRSRRPGVRTRRVQARGWVSSNTCRSRSRLTWV